MRCYFIPVLKFLCSLGDSISTNYISHPFLYQAIIRILNYCSVKVDFYGAAVLIQAKEPPISSLHMKYTHFYFLSFFADRTTAAFPWEMVTSWGLWGAAEQERLLIIILRMMSELNTGSMRAVCSSLASTQTFILQRLASRADDIDAGSFSPEPSHLFALLNLDLRPTCQSSTAIASTIRLPS